VIHDKPSKKAKKAVDLLKEKWRLMMSLEIVEYRAKSIVVSMEDDEYDDIAELIEYAGYEFERLD
jgi:hypothetical protein